MAAINGWCFGLLALGLCAVACGDDEKQPVQTPEAGAGAASAPESFPPALGPEDCVGQVSELELSQPNNANVWGGITLLEFQITGPSLRGFEVQLFDPDTEAWRIDYLPIPFQGQRDDGTYMLGVSVTPSDGSQDGDHKLRVRPTQDGCPPADWVESEEFQLWNPVEGSSWHGDIPGDHFDGAWLVSTGAASYDVTVESGTLDVELASDGSFSQTLALSLLTEDEGPYDGCTVSFTFAGSWRHELTSSYNGGTVYVSRQTLVGTEGTTCKAGPAPEDMLINNDSAFAEGLTLSQSSQYLNIDYLPTLAATPRAPTWSTNLAQEMLSRMPDWLGFAIADEGAGGAGTIYGSVSGQIGVQSLEIEKLPVK